MADVAIRKRRTLCLETPHRTRFARAFPTADLRSPGPLPRDSAHQNQDQALHQPWPFHLSALLISSCAKRANVYSRVEQWRKSVQIGMSVCITTRAKEIHWALFSTHMYRFWLSRNVCDSSCTRVARARCLLSRTPISDEISPALLRNILYFGLHTRRGVMLSKESAR